MLNIQSYEVKAKRKFISQITEHVANPLEYYYENSHKEWAKMIPYHSTAAIFVFLCNKWAVYAWNWGDVLISVISRALYGKFKWFDKSVKETLLKPSSGIYFNRINCLKTKYCISKYIGKAEWLQAIAHHNRLSKLTEDIASLLSPLVFTSFAVNIYFICIQVYLK
jgi:hypothetical protein